MKLQNMIIKDATVFQSKQGFICDMDGVTYHGSRRLDGVPKFAKCLKQNYRSFSYCSHCILNGVGGICRS